MWQAFYVCMTSFNSHNNLPNLILNKFRKENNFRNQATRVIPVVVGETKPQLTVICLLFRSQGTTVSQCIISPCV